MNARPITKVELEWMANRLIYLATPYSKLDDLEAAATVAANIAARLAQATHGAVFSPIVHGHALCRAGNLDPLKDSVAWEALNGRMVEECDIIVVAHMHGWDESDGVAAEVIAFTAAGKPVFDMPDIARVGDMKRRAPQKPARDRIDGRPIEEVNAEARDYLGHAQR